MSFNVDNYGNVYSNRPLARRRRRRGGLYKYEVAGSALAGVASMAAKQAVNWYGKPRQTKTNKRGYKSRRAPRKSFPKKVKGQIRELKRLAESDMGTLIYRNLGSTVFTCAIAESLHGALTGMSLANIELPLAQLKYYNPSAPSSLTTASGLTGSYQKEFLYNKMYSRYTCRNNYQVPCKLTMYIVAPKDATSISAITAFTNGLTDIGAPSAVSPAIFLTDSPQFNDLYRIIKSKSVELAPGRTCVLSHSPKPFQYDPSTSDSHSLSYNKNFHSYTLVVRLQGVIGHDVSAGQQTSMACAVDIEEYRVIEIKYSAGVDIKTIYINDDRDATFTNSGVVSSKPVSDNVTYSVS